MPLTTTSTHAINYSVKISNRAKRARIEVSPLGQVKVVVPKRFNNQLIPSFVAKHQIWLENVLKNTRHNDPTRHEPPERLEFKSLDEHWKISYASTTSDPLIQVDGRTKHIQLNNTDSTYINALTDWLQTYARQHLTAMLIKKSIQLGLPFNNVRIKNQKTRWGSCSSKKNINLNRNLLFLNPELVDYLLLHELCHTVHLNHSKHYWQMVDSFLPNYLIYDKQLNSALQTIPAWALPDT